MHVLRVATASASKGWLVAALLGVSPALGAASWVDTAAHRVAVAQVNGIALQYLDWGGTGRPLILIHGLGDNPHVFDDLAPAFTDKFRVIAYARRGHPGSELAGPYDTRTLTSDLLEFLNRLGITRADLAGWSLGGNEITALAASHPERVAHLVYLDSYDPADPAFRAAFAALPPQLVDVPAAARVSLPAYLAYRERTDFPEIRNVTRIEAYLRASVVVQPDGTVSDGIPPAVQEQLFKSLWSNPRRDYRSIQAPVLAIYAESVFDLRTPDASRRAAIREWESTYWRSFQESSIEQMRREIPSARILRVPGAHVNFFVVSKAEVVRAMRRFLN